MAATNIREFQLGIAKFNRDRNHGQRRKITRAVALRALQGVVLNTRVDTGRARGNWQVAESTPPSGYDADLGATQGRDTGRNVPSKRADPVSVGTSEILKMVGDDIIWIHNGVPYIGVLEDRDKMLVGQVEALRTWLRSQR